MSLKISKTENVMIVKKKLDTPSAITIIMNLFIIELLLDSSLLLNFLYSLITKYMIQEHIVNKSPNNIFNTIIILLGVL